uniref:Pectin acetylesterase n=1 Tax=Solanum lycopersicum TaxID=4081 RepID=A0A3Q7HZX6_SOLLC
MSGLGDIPSNVNVFEDCTTISNSLNMAKSSYLPLVEVKIQVANEVPLTKLMITTFTCPYGTFAFKRMSFGLCNAPATFQRCMMLIFSDMVENTIEVFMDDFSVVGRWMVRKCDIQKIDVGSSDIMQPWLFEGIHSKNESANLDFYDWNKVFVRNFDGGAFTRNVEYVNPATNLHFRGARIFETLMEELLARRLKNTKNVYTN